MDREMEQLVVQSERLRTKSQLLQLQAEAMTQRLVTLFARSDRLCRSLELEEPPQE